MKKKKTTVCITLICILFPRKVHIDSFYTKFPSKFANHFEVALSSRSSDQLTINIILKMEKGVKNLKQIKYKHNY